MLWIQRNAKYREKKWNRLKVFKHPLGGRDDCEHQIISVLNSYTKIP